MSFERTAAHVPILETERLRLRAHRTDDYPACAALWADAAVVKYIGGKPLTPQQTWMRMLAYAGHWTLLGFGYWVIADRTSDAYLGEVGFADFKRDVAPAMHGFPELGWALATHASGRGLATEAARAACAWGDVHFEGTRTTCLIGEGNAASISVARKCGFVRFDRTTIDGNATLFFERPRATSSNNLV